MYICSSLFADLVRRGAAPWGSHLCLYINKTSMDIGKDDFVTFDLAF